MHSPIQLPALLANETGTALVPRAAAHPLIAEVGRAGQVVWEEFFVGQLRNRSTRTAYRRAVVRFLDWIGQRGVPLTEITPGMVGNYFDEHPGSIPTRKLELAGLRGFFNHLVIRHLVVLNPAASVRGEKYEVIEGKTPEITVQQARHLLGSVNADKAVGRRDKALIATLIYTAARAGAVAKLRRKHLVFDGVRYALQFQEKGGKAREIPVREDLRDLLLDYLKPLSNDEADAGSSGDEPLFRSADGRTGRLTANGITGADICRIVKRRLKDAGLPARLSPHSFRVLTITDLLAQGVALEDCQMLAGHSDPRTTRLYDRRPKRVTRNLVERISV